MDDIAYFISKNQFKLAIDKLEELGESKDNASLLRSQLEEINSDRLAKMNVEEKEGVLKVSILRARDMLSAKVITLEGGKSGEALDEESDIANNKEAFSILDAIDELSLNHYTIVNNYVRYRPPHCRWKAIKDLTNNLLKSCTSISEEYENYLIYAFPGTGKTFLLTQFWETYRTSHNIKKVEIDLKDRSLNGQILEEKLKECKEQTCPVLCILDEIDSKPEFYPILHDAVDLNKKQGERHPNVVFVAIGSGGKSLQGLRDSLKSSFKGDDLQTRLVHGFEIPPLSVGDRMVIASEIARNIGICEIEKTVLHFIMTNDELQNARIIYKWFNKIPLQNVNNRCTSIHDKDIRYDDLFNAEQGNKNIKEKYFRDFKSEFEHFQDSYLHIS